MKVTGQQKRISAITLLDILIVIVVLGALAALLANKLIVERKFVRRIQCVSNLNRTHILFTSWADLHSGGYPTGIHDTNSNPLEFDSGPNAYRHFRVVTAWSPTPAKTFFCPAESDPARTAASNYIAFNNSNVSYFVTLAGYRTTSKMFVAGDRNITNGTPPKEGIMEVTAAQLPGWTTELHREIGNVLLTDGSVEQSSRARLQELVANSGAVTNRILLPVLGQ